MPGPIYQVTVEVLDQRGLQGARSNTIRNSGIDGGNRPRIETISCPFRLLASI